MIAGNHRATLPIERGVVFRAAGSWWLAQESPWDAGGQVGVVVRAYELAGYGTEHGSVTSVTRVSDELVTVQIAAAKILPSRVHLSKKVTP